MKTRIIIALLPILLVVFALTRCNRASAQIQSTAYALMLKKMYRHTVPLISVEQLASKTDDHVLLDTRAKSEYETSHIANARWVDYDTFSLKSVVNLPKDTPIVVYCSVGYRSERVGEKLLNEGFVNVQNLHGGIFEWVNQNHPVVDESGQATPKVHAFSKTWGIWLRKGEKVYK